MEQGSIDWDYRGEIKVLMINLRDVPFTFTRGMRVAQMVLAPVIQGGFAPVMQIETTGRMEAGFGSTGGIE